MRIGLIASVILGAFLLASYAVLGVVGSRADARTERRTSCMEIEKLKAAYRAEALENYRKLDQNLRLLNIKKTPEIVAAARKTRDAKLRRFAARSCL